MNERPAPTPFEQAFGSLAVLRQVLDSAPDAMLIVDAGGAIRYWNTEAEKLFGYGEDAIRGRSVETLVPARLADAHRAHRGRYMQQPQRRPMGIGMELRGLRSDGTEVPIEVSLNAVTIGGGAYVIASVRDIGAKLRAEEDQRRLRQQEMLLAMWEQTLRSSSFDAACRVTVQGVRDALAARRICVYEFAPGRGSRLVRVAYDTDADGNPIWVDLAALPQVAALLQDETDAAATAAPAVAMRLYNDAQGVELVLSLRAHTGILGALTIARPAGAWFGSDDIYVAQSVAHLLAHALARSQSDQLLVAAAQMEALGQLSSGIAHEFNNLLSIMAGNLEILSARLQDNASMEKMVRAALRATRRGGELTKRLLMLAHKQPAKVAAYHIQQLLPGLAELVTRAVGERIEVLLDVPSDLPAVALDPSVLDACIINLATNARDAMPDGGRLTLGAGFVRLDAAPDPEHAAQFAPGEFVVVAVADTGCGMTEEVRRRAFEPFFTTKEAGRGTGLGLVLVRSLMHQIGGCLTLHSAAGFGTVVKLYFPVARTAVSGSRTEAPRGAGERVLLVEDDEAVRETTTLLLEDLGYAVAAVDSVAAARAELACRADIAIVFSDVALGGPADGIDLADELRRSRPSLPVVLTSGYAASLSARLGDHPAVASLLAKPFSREQLATALRDALVRPRAD
ncbi:PAS domain S-box [Mizugakiibacter sediminis]|uniref:histidine kinase n=1 Tax=Mizugakiibacter sediminis TaxID=1475481 RepID=A0A0K8QRA8_9GAMM|nr:PAS domain-containing hybrid sensor histidine kinase/response regulator [Mizugakiibacter sediminis]GAP66932.1 PAS domain S-box [Mizugakiibacter sediminis]